MNYKVLFLSCLVLFSCSKARCPQPETQPSSHTVTLQPANEGKDAVINDLAPTTNFGNSPFVAIEAWTQSSINRIQRSLIDFDYSSIPSGALLQVQC